MKWFTPEWLGLCISAIIRSKDPCFTQTTISTPILIMRKATPSITNPQQKSTSGNYHLEPSRTVVTACWPMKQPQQTVNNQIFGFNQKNELDTNGKFQDYLWMKIAAMFLQLISSQ